MQKRTTVPIIGFAITCLLAAPAQAGFWDSQKKGTNFFNRHETKDRIQAAKDAGLSFVRLTFTKWKPSRESLSPGEFLTGDLDGYEGLERDDLARLREILSWYDEAELKVILTPLSVHGRRWRQHNDREHDSRLFENPVYHKQVAQFWKDLARELRDHPAIAGYNILNEPVPERSDAFHSDWWSDLDAYRDYCRGIRGSAADVNRLYEAVHKSIRSVDGKTPVVIDSPFWSTPWAVTCLEPLDDPRVLYSFHMYEPYPYTDYRRDGEYTYPGRIPFDGQTEENARRWDRGRLEEFFQPVDDWLERHGIHADRVLVGEFGLYRRAPGAHRYLSDLIDVFNDRGWHWAFYSFREDTWPGMDYELGRFELPESYFRQWEDGALPSRKEYYQPNPLWSALQQGL